MTSKRLTYIDLFCGAGGLSLGFENQNFCNVFSIDIEESFCNTYRSNFPMHRLIQKDISELSTDEINILTKRRDIDVIVGGPPCQGFSMAGNIGRQFIDDSRNHLFKEFARIVGIVKPKCFVMENVARLFTHNKGRTKGQIITLFESYGYSVSCKVLNSADFGVPQFRHRVVFIGVLQDDNRPAPVIEPIISTDKYISIKMAIDSLPILSSGGSSYIPNHIAMKHSEQMLSKMSYIKDGGNRFDIPEKLRPLTGDVRKYIRYNSSKPSICVTGDMRKVFHYEQNRALTVRELARIQSFPDTFIFKGNSISQQQQVGNSVPPLLAEAIAKMIKEYLKNGK